ncbi:MAG: isocitrate/isopropylmalate dehydrogenase family protein [Synergistaceae bacterium]|jgi:3-isopropylmalate dehydrogenase|nr:isocitrate/isopropylmalate dehydrogenase family protein [Synergistaceae bacterium]
MSKDPALKKKFSVAVIPGDGIGPEVIAETRKIVDVAGRLDGASFEWVEYPFGASRYIETGEILPGSAIAELGRHSAMLLGAIGRPDVKPGILERGILLTLRFVFDQYVNLRPAMSLPNVPTPVPLNGEKMNSVVIRENTEDLYMGLGGVTRDGRLETILDLERGSYVLKGKMELSMSQKFPFAAQVALNTEPGVSRITRYACETAKKRGEKRVTIVTKSNAAPALYGFFEDVARGVIESEYPDIASDIVNVDALCYHLVRRPCAYGVLLCPNLFGDIVSDLQAGLAGGLGTAAGGNIGDGLSMFEPVHGSAPDIAGTGRANPIAAILSGAMMLRHLNLEKSASAIERAASEYLESSEKRRLPFEFSGGAACSEVGDAIAKRI